MDNSFTHLDWSLVRAFLAVAETGSLSAAARNLSQSQPTLGRQIKLLEEQFNLRLFERQPRGLTLTPTGESLLQPARDMRDAFSQLSLRAAGQDSPPWVAQGVGRPDLGTGATGLQQQRDAVGYNWTTIGLQLDYN